MIGLKKGKPLVMKVCAVSDQSRALVVGSFENSALIKSNDCLDNIDVLFIVSDMDTHECESVTLALTQKTHDKSVLTLVLLAEDKQTAAMNKLQQQVNALLIISGEGWGNMSISESYALIVQRMMYVDKGSNCPNYKDLCKIVGVNQKLFVSYCTAHSDTEFETVGERLLSAYPQKRLLGIEYALFFGRFNESNLMGLSVVVSGLEHLLQEGCHLFFTWAEVVQENRYFDGILFTR